jgi:hypothetical protein
LRLDVDLWIRRIYASTFEWSLGKLQPPGDVRSGRKAKEYWHERIVISS